MFLSRIQNVSLLSTCRVFKSVSQRNTVCSNISRNFCMLRPHSLFLKNPSIFKKEHLIRSLSTNTNTVHRGALAKQVKLVKGFSITTSIIGMGLQPFILMKLYASSAVASVAVGFVGSFFIVGTPVLLHWIAKRYVLKLDLNPETKEFSATVLSIFNREKEVKFTADDVTIPELPIFLTNIMVRGNPMFVDSKDFSDLSAYKHLMSYDKPINLHLNEEAVKENVEK